MKEVPLLNKHLSPLLHAFLNNSDTTKTCVFFQFINEIIDI